MNKFVSMSDYKEREYPDVKNPQQEEKPEDANLLRQGNKKSISMSDYKEVVHVRDHGKEIPKVGIQRPDSDIDFTMTKYEPGRYLHNRINSKAWLGRRVFIIGGGKSLKDFDFKQLDGEIVIAVNRSLEHYPKAAMCVFLDDRFFGWSENGTLGENHKKIWEEFLGYKVTVSKTAFPYPEEIVAVDYRKKDLGYLSPALKDGIYIGTNSGFAALQIAATMGSTPIYLLGFDMEGGNGNSKQEWFHGGYPEVSDRTVYNAYRGDFEGAAAHYRAVGIDVVNLSMDSTLQCFRKDKIENIIKPRRPVIVSFYTKDYTELAKRMIQSVQLFGFEYEVVEMKEKGKWIDNMYARASFVKQMLTKHQRDVVWLDCDAVMQAYPELFDNFGDDFGAHIHEWKDRGKELLGGTMYFSFNKKVMALCDRWIELNGVMPKQALTQRILQEAIKGWGGNILNLPGTYTQIFDLMADEGNPVIEHFQASRQFRGKKVEVAGKS